MRAIRIGLLGCGVVGQGILRLLREHAGSLERRLGAPIEVRRVVAKTEGKARSYVAPELLSYDPETVLGDPEIDVVVEVIGGLDPAGRYVRTALERGKSVVTANKFLLAEEGHALFELAEERGADLYFEAAVCGGIPVIRVLREALVADSVVAVRGIVNGTSNYILSRMQSEQIDYGVALAAAQEAGYAEADPTLDVNGGDATHKLTILATLAFGAKLLPSHVTTEGIEHITAIDMKMAERFGYVIKLLATARSLPVGMLDLRVHPALVPKTSVLASIHGALNAVYLEGAMLGPSLLSGYGAGAMPTAMSVVSDLVDVGRNILRDSRGRVPQRTVPSGMLLRREVQPAGMHVSPYYLRFAVMDRPNVIAKIASVLGAFDIAIHQMIQEARASGPKAPVHVVVLTHPTRDDALRSALREIQMLSGIVEPPRAIRIETAA
ncbi:MAG: homoserine dehydrogenase [Deltaproteobacteria bacterium]|nr:homoserine dehydrogenase [Deltaproteobacteria bacterium]